MITAELLSMLWCPTCQAGGLRRPPDLPEDPPPDDGELRCDACDTAYAIRFGFPILIPEAALTGPEWKLWRDHLEKFQARREARIINPEQTITRLAGKSHPQPSFAAFTGIEEGTVLDVGCGPGKFRFHFDESRVRYFGLDPIVLPEVSDFPFVQGLAEYIPFKDDAFTDVVVLAALDHFRDLERFLKEARRVLRPGGRLHVLQSVHQARGPISTVKVLAHKIKDAWEDRTTVAYGRQVPKHLAEFTDRSLLECMEGAFDVVARERYSATWYSPDKLFFSFAPREPASAPTASLRHAVR